MRGLIKALVAAVALTAPLYANALPITWTYSGACTKGACGSMGSISGTVVGDPTNFGPNGEVNEYFSLFGDLTSWSFVVGSQTFSGTRGSGAYQLDGGGNIVSGSMSFDNLFTLDLDVGSSTWSITTSGCPIFCPSTSASGTGSYSRVTSVPEPATLALFGLGLLGVGLARRRRI